MNVAPAGGAVSYAVRTEASIALPDSRDFASKLSIGQIIKGRVLLQYEGNRYLVAFDGIERTVDSSIPFRTGELLRGKVVALGDRVELQYLPEGREGPSEHGGSQVREPSAPALPPSDLDALFARYQARLTAEGRDSLMRTMRTAPDRDLVALAGVTLAKLQLPQNPQLLKSIAAALARNPSNEAAQPRDIAAPVFTAPGLAPQLRELVRQALQEPVDRDDATTPVQKQPSATTGPSVSGTNPGRTGMDSRDAPLPRFGGSLLNIQSGGSVGHRIGTLPLIVGNRLVEVDIAVFDHEPDRPTPSGNRHRALVFVLNLSELGRVEISATVIKERLRIQIGTDRADSAAEMSRHGSVLRQALMDAGWSVDEVTYEVRDSSASNPAVRSVVEHVIAQDSLNRLI